MHPTDGNTYAINSMMEEREDYDLKREMELEIQELCNEVDVLIAKLAEVEAERDDLAKVVDGIENLWRFWSDKARESVGRCGDYRRRAEAAEDALPAAYRAGVEDALDHVQGFITLYEKDMTKIGKILSEGKCPSVWYRVFRVSLDAVKAVRSAIRALPTPAAAELMARIAEEAGQ